MGVVALLTVSVIAGLVLMLLVMAHIDGKEKITKAAKIELEAKRALINRIDDLAFENRDVNPELSVQIRDEILKHRRELSGRDL